ncbi:DUF4442 domain-containing protein [Wenyingzhuangia sp. chi5]|uniref:DUF4442 domain-containing protein n=1 Tax=Wenyingzhuangia gilva TaxID=3057677 RepID=A0ABT8VNQ1_9FLAO|nr:DUF4442 domain-containing protein [Wenyingzhuangia sp. chi5]MDO3693600.1 DUF4442 domain-containing protein [Wenyingzhuangia sp. chi5]
MKLTVKQFNRFILYKLPAAYLCGVRLVDLNNDSAVAKVRFKWINQNPFKSIYFAVLAMAAELSTGVLVLKQTQESKLRFSTLVVRMNAQFLKKAVGLIRFTCIDGADIQKHIYTAMETKEGVAFTLESIGVDEMGDEVARFEFSWSIKIKE